MYNETEILRKLTRARTHLLLRQPFFGTLCLRLKLVQASLATMATDGRRILYSESFVNSLTPAELEGVLAHEVLHCALGHHCRRGARDSQIWNQAADLAINPLLLANGFTLPDGALFDHAFDNLSAEEIYARLSQGKNDPPGSSGAPQQSATGGSGSTAASQAQATPPLNTPRPSSNQDGPASNATFGTGEARPGGFGEVLDATQEDGAPASDAENRRQQHEWNIAAEQALRSAKTCGTEPVNVERQLQESRESKQDWRSTLRDFVSAHDPLDYRWTPPNRRHIYAGLYLPSVERRGIGPIVIAVDTSGSIGTKELEQFAGEISAIANEAQPECIHVVYCDAEVQAFQEFQAADPIQLEPKGGGGTDFRPPFDWVERNGIVPACLVYLTDLCCHSFPDPPAYPVLWATDSRRTAPFGETIEITLD